MQPQDFAAKIDEAMGAHGMWKLRLGTAIRTGICEIDARTAGCDDQCAFGRWLYGDSFDPQTRAGVPYQVVRRLHAEFHQCAGAVLEKALAGRQVEAQQLLAGEFTARSEKLGRAMAKWKGEALQRRAA